jgi:hypothetical protein
MPRTQTYIRQIVTPYQGPWFIPDYARQKGDLPKASACVECPLADHPDPGRNDHLNHLRPVLPRLPHTLDDCLTERNCARLARPPPRVDGDAFRSKSAFGPRRGGATRP